jgi:hypothetical protein
MKRLLLSLTIALISAAALSAAPLCTDLTGSNVITGGFTCELGGLTFSNFSATGTAPITLMQATLVGSTVYLTFNPFVVGVDDRYFYMQVDGNIGGVDLTNGGNSATSIFERVCATPIGMANICTGGEVNQIAELNAAGGGSDEVMFQGDGYSTIYIYKDILSGTDGHLSSFTQSFHAVPEPMTFGLIGAGLLGLGLLRRKIRS